MKLNLLKAVYSYYFPEVRRLMHKAERRLAPELFKLSTPVRSLKHLSQLYDPALELSESDGLIDLDLLHEPILSRIAALYADALPGLDQFGHRYPTAGSSEGLFHLIAGLKSEGIESIYTIKGEYEGFSAYASHLGLRTIEVDPMTDTRLCSKPGVWIISYPFAKNGSILPASFIHQICNQGHRIILDFAYLGLTAPFSLDIAHPNIIAAVCSLSKPFGLFRFRIGYLFSRREIPSLYANRWFKDIGRHLQGLLVVEQLGLNGIYKRYRKTQVQIVEALRERFQAPFKTADALLITNISVDECPEKFREQFRPYLRYDNYRFCLTPYFEQVEANHARFRKAPEDAAAGVAASKTFLSQGW